MSVFDDFENLTATKPASLDDGPLAALFVARQLERLADAAEVPGWLRHAFAKANAGLFGVLPSGMELAPVTDIELEFAAFCGGGRPKKGEVVRFAQEADKYHVYLCDTLADWADVVPVDMCRVLDHHPTVAEVAALVASRDTGTKAAFPPPPAAYGFVDVPGHYDLASWGAGYAAGLNEARKSNTTPRLRLHPDGHWMPDTPGEWDYMRREGGESLRVTVYEYKGGLIIHFPDDYEQSVRVVEPGRWDWIAPTGDGEITP